MTWLEMIAHYKGNRDLLRETEEARFAASAGEPQDSSHRRALRWLGGRLTDWGQRLQERYAAPATMPSRQRPLTG
jgi:hypothetical protein